jgi:hypothetical protein
MRHDVDALCALGIFLITLLPVLKLGQCPSERCGTTISRHLVRVISIHNRCLSLPTWPDNGHYLDEFQAEPILKNLGFLKDCILRQFVEAVHEEEHLSGLAGPQSLKEGFAPDLGVLSYIVPFAKEQ